ncbi:MAG: transposase [Deltaproteobacteria bacterium]|nr:transposase [Deltaproteobacteria bacterium]MBI2341407.1 transposase [Deltaproteobacteria bacterium]MBI2974608.1 transposase [Deltaproteobacteria bacterium]
MASNMSRLPLIHIPFGLYSVVSKCNNDEFLFNTPEKFELYIRHLIECKKELKFQIYDIVCMSNHVHELYRVSAQTTIAQILQRVKGFFSLKFNKKFGRTGHFWRNKPFYRIIENEEYAFNTMNYFHWNPVRAGLVSTPQDWPYSGYRFHIMKEKSILLSKLLDRLPFQLYPPDQNESARKKTAEILCSKRLRFIGSDLFRETMKNKFRAA